MTRTHIIAVLATTLSMAKYYAALLGPDADSIHALLVDAYAKAEDLQ